MKGWCRWLVLLGFAFTLSSASGASLSLGEAANRYQHNLARAERYVILGNRELARQATIDAVRIFNEVLAPALAQEGPSESVLLRDQLRQLANAVEMGDSISVAILRQRCWIALLDASFKRTQRYLERGWVDEIRWWLAIREFPRTGSSTIATEAVAALQKGTLTPDEAKQRIIADLLQTYAGELRYAIAETQRTLAAGYAQRAASWGARIEGLTQLLAPNLRDRLGKERAETVLDQSEKLLAAIERGALEEATQRLNRFDALLATYSPVGLPPEEIDRLVGLLLRFIKLIDFDYNIGVRNGQIVIPLDYREAVVFRDRAEQLLGSLQGEMTPETVAQLRALFAEMKTVILNKGDGERITTLSHEAADLVHKAFAAVEVKRDWRSVFPLLFETLDQIPELAAAQRWEEAEMKRLEAYAFFDPDIEQYLMPRAPSLVVALERSFWEGSADRPGLQRLIAERAEAQRLREHIAALKKELNEGKARLSAQASPLAVLLQSLAIIIREGLEAVLVIGALLGVLRTMQGNEYMPYVWGGVSLAVLASFALWLLAEHIVTITTVQRELLEGVTALLAAAVLVYVTHWIFHKTYVVQWVRFVQTKIQQSVSDGHLFAVGMLSFFVVFREGFETVLFYEALLLDSPPVWVFSGFLIGVAGTIFIAWLLLKLGRRLPIEKFFAATGILLMILALVFTGFGMRGLQTAGVIESTPVPHFPESTFLQLYLGIFPTWESLMAQAALLLMFLVGVLGIVVVARKNRAATSS